MAFDGTEGSQITLAEATTLMQNYQAANPNMPHGHYIGKELIESILAQSGCKGIRCYYGLDSNGDSQLIMVGADANEQDMFTGIIADRAHPTP